jgi:hypothetical protein
MGKMITGTGSRAVNAGSFKGVIAVSNLAARSFSSPASFSGPPSLLCTLPLPSPKQVRPMRVSTSALLLAALAAPALAHDGHHTKRAAHHDAAKRAAAAKRGDVPFTWFVDGLGACGWVNQPGDFIVALNSPQFAGGSNCGKKIVVTVNGKSAEATVADEVCAAPFR